MTFGRARTAGAGIPLESRNTAMRAAPRLIAFALAILAGVLAGFTGAAADMSADNPAPSLPNTQAVAPVRSAANREALAWGLVAITVPA